ncbi:MAG: hypothetical protein K6343_04080 [Caldisericaceae bacterium]
MIIIIITAVILLLIIVSTDYYSRGRGTKTVKMLERAQLGWSGIYLTLLDYKFVHPSIEEKFQKYIAFQVLLDGSKNRTKNDYVHFGEHYNCKSYKCYELYGCFIVAGKLHSKQTSYGSIHPEDAVKLFGNKFPIIGLGKLENNIAFGWVVFKVPEDFEINEFIYTHFERDDLDKIFPNATVKVIFKEPIK